MGIKTDIYRSALRDYDSIKSASESKVRELKEILYRHNPRLEEIDREVNLAGVDAAKKIIRRPADREAIKAELNEKLSSLETEKQHIYDELGVTDEYFNTAYRCRKCHDTGMVDGKECSCFRQYLIKKAYGRSLLNELSDDETFGNFNPTYYSADDADIYGVSSYESIRIAFNTCVEFVKNFGKNYKNILITGKTGLGKTFLCNAMAKSVLSHGFTVIYISAGRLFKTLADEQFSRNEDEEYSSFYDDVLSVDLLIIDDLGTEFSTTLVSSQIFNIINERMLNTKPTVISTNLTPKEIQDQYSDRVLSRIMDGFDMLKITGEDIRIQKKTMGK